MELAGNACNRQDDLVFDFGFHRGEETGYYLVILCLGSMAVPPSFCWVSLCGTSALDSALGRSPLVSFTGLGG